jgi:hypothetical protein
MDNVQNFDSIVIYHSHNQYLDYARFEVLAAVVTKSSVFWDSTRFQQITGCSWSRQHAKSQKVASSIPDEVLILGIGILLHV